jgi:hypothetical protein
MMERTSSKVAAALGVLLLIVLGAIWLSRQSSSPSGSDRRAASASPGSPGSQAPAPSSSGTGALGTLQERKPKPDMLPMPNCWDGLAEFDRTASLDTFRGALAAAVSARDRVLAEYLQERLTELVGDDPAKALQVLSWAEQASQAELGVYMEALKAAPAVHRKEVAQKLLAMGEDKGGQLMHRAAALDTLETQRSLAPADIQRLKAIAMDTTVDSVAWVSARTLGRVMKEDFERTGTYAPYWQELLDVGEKSEDMAVRKLALEMPSYSNPILDEGSIGRLSTILETDRERDVREEAAFQLAVTESPDKALAAYKASFPKEHDVCVRWAIFRFAVRAAGVGAFPLLQEFARQDPRFQPDVEDFQRLYADGTVDFSRVWLGKEERFNCLMEEGAPH